MKIFITGGTGLIGSRLVRLLLDHAHEVSVLTRDVEKARLKLGNNIHFCRSLSTLNSFDEYDAVINLAGESIARWRWTPKRKDLLNQSRWRITQQLTQLFLSSKVPPSVFISGSAVGYYGSQGDTILTEKSKACDEFTHRLCEQWETYALQTQSDKTRVCLLRTGIVLSAEGGALAKMLLPFKLGLGSVIGKGNQYISWIHIDDMVRAIYFLLTTPSAQGAFNMTAPNPVSNKYFSKTLAQTLGKPCWFVIPAFVLSLLMGEASTLLVDGQRVIPQKLKQLKYNFMYNTVVESLENIINSN